MAQKVFANALSVAHKGTSGTVSGSLPDVCLTPPAGPGAPIPLPYANMLDAQASAGDKKAKADQKKLMDDAAKNGYKAESATQCAIKTAGDEAGAVGGIASSKTTGKTKFVNYTMDVKLEGKNVARLLDVTTSNHP